MKTMINILVFFISIYSSAMEKHPVVVLNGSSCAGKSSIAYHLKQKLGTDWALISYDDYRRSFFTQHYRFLELLPDDYKYTEVTVFFDDIKKHLSLLGEQEKSVKEDLVDNFFKKANREFYKHIGKISQAQSIIVDTIILSQQQKNIMEQQLERKVIMVFVHVPLADIISRITQRNSVGIDEARYANRVLFFYPDFYMLNTNGTSSFDGNISVQDIELTVERSLTLPSSLQFPIGKILSQKIIEKFGIQNIERQQVAKLIPRLSYDHIIDTNLADSTQCALLLYNQLKNRS